MPKDIRYDENNPYADEDKKAREEEQEQFNGYLMVDEEGIEEETTDKPKKEKKVEESYDDGEMAPASVIPENEQVVMVDNAKVNKLAEGSKLKLVISKDKKSAAVFFEDSKVGELKPAFVQKMCIEKQGKFAECLLNSKQPPVMIKIRYFASKGKGRTSI